jgi:hypothetical protein
LAAAGHHQPKFPAFFHHPGLPNGGSGDPTADLYAHLASPNLFNALKRKYPIALGHKQPVGGFVVDPDSPMLKMPFLKDYFAKHPLDLSDVAARTASYASSLKEEDDIAERQSPSINESSSSVAGDLASTEDTKPDIGGNSGTEGKQSSGSGHERGGGGRKPQGRGSRLERMIAAEYKILSEYSDPANGSAPEVLPAITPELMKSRRTHSLQLAIGEILHNRASVQSAATKYHIPRETLRRHYQRYLKAMGINNKEMSPGAGGTATGGSGGGGRHAAAANSMPTAKSSIETLAAAAALAGGGGGEEGSNYSSLLDIGQAYGLWNPGEENSNDMSGPRDLKIVEEDDDDEEEEEEEEEEDETHSDDKENEEEIRATQVRNQSAVYIMTQRDLSAISDGIF